MMTEEHEFDTVKRTIVEGMDNVAGVVDELLGLLKAAPADTQSRLREYTQQAEDVADEVRRVCRQAAECSSRHHGISILPITGAAQAVDRSRLVIAGVQTALQHLAASGVEDGATVTDLTAFDTKNGGVLTRIATQLQQLQLQETLGTCTEPTHEVAGTTAAVPITSGAANISVAHPEAHTAIGSSEHIGPAGSHEPSAGEKVKQFVTEAGQDIREGVEEAAEYLKSKLPGHHSQESAGLG